MPPSPKQLSSFALPPSTLHSPAFIAATTLGLIAILASSLLLSIVLARYTRCCLRRRVRDEESIVGITGLGIENGIGGDRVVQEKVDLAYPSKAYITRDKFGIAFDSQRAAFRSTVPLPLSSSLSTGTLERSPLIDSPAISPPPSSPATTLSSTPASALPPSPSILHTHLVPLAPRTPRHTPSPESKEKKRESRGLARLREEKERVYALKEREYERHLERVAEKQKEEGDAWYDRPANVKVDVNSRDNPLYIASPPQPSLSLASPASLPAASPVASSPWPQFSTFALNSPHHTPPRTTTTPPSAKRKGILKSSTSSDIARMKESFLLPSPSYSRSSSSSPTSPLRIRKSKSSPFLPSSLAQSFSSSRLLASSSSHLFSSSTSSRHPSPNSRIRHSESLYVQPHPSSMAVRTKGSENTPVVEYYPVYWEELEDEIKALSENEAEKGENKGGLGLGMGGSVDDILAAFGYK